MTIGFMQAFELVGAGLLAGIGLFVWFADRVARHYGDVDSVSGCLTRLVVTSLMAACIFLLWLVVG
jgi:hypothetical protein